jgi:hypothetical protein
MARPAGAGPRPYDAPVQTKKQGGELVGRQERLEWIVERL